MMLSSISTSHMYRIIERLKSSQHQKSTDRNYLGIWRNFNNFIIKLDVKPDTWEARASLYGAYLVESGVQSSTLKSYMSAIKKVLTLDGYVWDQNKLLLNTLTNACRLINDRVRTRLPIRFHLLEIMLFEIHRKFTENRAVLFGVSLHEHYNVCLLWVTQDRGTNSKCARSEGKRVHISTNRNKFLLVLHSSKTHGRNKKTTKN